MPGIRPNILSMAGYVPGEQPRDGELHQAEHQREPVPAVAAGLRGHSGNARPATGCASIPSRWATRSARRPARFWASIPKQILIGNGSDDILTILTRAFVPEGGLIASPTPSYILYRSLAEIQGARFETVPFTR